jgi:hypothetical protein
MHDHHYSMHYHFRDILCAILAGREIDEAGNVVKVDLQKTKSSMINVALEKESKKKENPYLAHKSQQSGPPGLPGTELASTVEVLDDRLPKGRGRELRAKKALHFVEEGKYIEQAAKTQHKEERMIIAGYSSGRKGLQV